MRPIIPNTTRRADLKAAIKRAKADELIRLEDLAGLWGTSKTNFVNVLNSIKRTFEFPAWVKGPNNTHLYPAKPAFEAMLKWETRNDEVTAARQERAAAILGGNGKGKASETPLHNPNELATLNKLAADIEDRERDQRLYIPASEVSATGAEVFSLFSEFCGSLENHVDPNGQLSADIRKRIREGGHRTLMQIHERMKGLLDAQPAANRGAPDRARKSRPRR